MRTVAPQNTAIGEFRPSHESPIYPYTTRQYHCQEEVAHKTNEFRSLTWKIQQPDASMVWSKVKVVLPLSIRCLDESARPLDMRISARMPACNIALAETPMRAFRESTLSLNGRTFSELNFYRDTLDACYRGNGPQQYGDNHSLKPIASRDLQVQDPDHHILVRNPATGAAIPDTVVRVSDVQDQVAARSNNLLNSNGPFIERARIWQDNLDAEGRVWKGEITAYLELGPFANRDRASSDVPAVPYVRDFYLRLQFANQPSKFDTLHDRASIDRTIASLLLEYALTPHIVFPGDAPGWPNRGFPHNFQFQWTKKPYLEVMYTKYMGSMSPEYRLRCFERQYEQSDNRFKMEPDPVTLTSQKERVRIVTRLNSYPSKIYLYCEPADEYKGAFVTGGCRRSCLLEDLHCRINQRSDVLFSPSQEQCFEFFQKNTASDLDYAAWRKAPLYVFTPADLGQPDMLAGDARITWIEWSANASLTPLQCQERLCQRRQREMVAIGYDHDFTTHDTAYNTSVDNPSTQIRASMSAIQKTNYTSSKWFKGAKQLTYIDLRHEHEVMPGSLAINFQHAGSDLREHSHQMKPTYNYFKSQYDAPPTDMDFQPIGMPLEKLQYFNGFIWLFVDITNGSAGSMAYYAPKSGPLICENKHRGVNYINSWDYVTRTTTSTYHTGEPKYTYQVNLQHVSAMAGQNMNARYGCVVGRPDKDSGVDKDQAVFKAWVTDGNGIRGTDKDTSKKGPETSAGVFSTGCELTAPHAYEVNERQSDKRWFCFYPSTAMLAGTGTDKELTWLFTRDALEGANYKPTADETTHVSNKGCQYPIEQVTCKFKHVEIGQHTAANNLTPTEQGNGVEIQMNTLEQRGFEIQMIGAAGAAFEEVGWEYQLKALYENDNAQYIFGDRGQPTKVVDNLRGV